MVSCQLNVIRYFCKSTASADLGGGIWILASDVVFYGGGGKPNVIVDGAVRLYLVYDLRFFAICEDDSLVARSAKNSFRRFVCLAADEFRGLIILAAEVEKMIAVVDDSGRLCVVIHTLELCEALQDKAD